MRTLPAGGRLGAELRSRSGLLLVAGGGVLWGTTGVVVRFVHDRSGLSAVSIGFYRLAAAAAVLAWWQVHPVLRMWAAASSRQRRLLVSGGAGLGIYQALYFAAVQHVGVSTSTLISVGTAPLSLGVWSAVRNRRAPTPLSAVTLVAALAGLMLISFAEPGHEVAPHPVLGIVEAIGSGLGYALCTHWNTELSPLAKPLTLTAVSSAFGALVLFPVAAYAGLGWSPDGSVAASLVYLGVFSTVLAYGMFFAGLRSTAADVAAILTLMEPLTATVLAVGLLGEQLSVFGWVGAALLMGAVAALCVRLPMAALGP